MKESSQLMFPLPRGRKFGSSRQETNHKLFDNCISSFKVLLICSSQFLGFRSILAIFDFSPNVLLLRVNISHKVPMWTIYIIVTLEGANNWTGETALLQDI